MILKRPPYYTGVPSDHFDGKRFHTGSKPFLHKFRDILKWRLFTHRPRWPKKSPQIKLSQPPTRVDKHLSITYVGHATLLIQTANLNILTDPNFSKNAGPVSWLGPKRVQPPGLNLSTLPPIDIIFISHNHYDHLDMPSLKRLWKRDRPLIITPLGNDTIIKRTNPKMRVQTLDWHEKISLSPQVSLQLLPCQHWSGRTLWDRNKALWGAACFYFEHKTLLFVGDTGFNQALFEKMKTSMGTSPDVTVLPIGCYEPNWLMSYAHMSPEEAWKAFKILEGQYLLPIHYDVFPLASEPFGEALSRLKQAAGHSWNKVLHLKVGENFDTA